MSDYDSGLPVRLRDEDNLPFTENNPLPVSLEEAEGDEIQDFQKDEDVSAFGASVVEHIYTVNTGKKFNFSSVLFAGSGRMKVEVQVETGVGTDVFETKAVAFSSTAKLSDVIPFSKNINVAEGVKVKLLKSNLDNRPQDLYTTIIGLEKSA